LFFGSVSASHYLHLRVDAAVSTGTLTTNALSHETLHDSKSVPKKPSGGKPASVRSESNSNVLPIRLENKN